MCIRDRYRADLPAGETQWGKIILDYAQSAVDYMAALTQNSLSVMEDCLLYTSSLIL